MKRKWTAMFTAACMAVMQLSVLPVPMAEQIVPALNAAAAETASGTCGENLTWTLDDAGTLTITGIGDMIEWQQIGDIPWRYEDVTRVIIEDGVTSIGHDSFATMDMEEVYLPDSLRRIGKCAFMDCTSLRTVSVLNDPFSIPEDQYLYDENGDLMVPEEIGIGYWAFSNCVSLTTFVLPAGIASTDNEGFNNTPKLKAFIVRNPYQTLNIALDYYSSPTVYGYEGTAAREFADAAGRDFAAIDVNGKVSMMMGELSGFCGALYWNYTPGENGTDGTLTIEGDGELPALSDYPWSPLSALIKEIVLTEGVSSVNAAAFSGCDALELLRVENTECVFSECEADTFPQNIVIYCHTDSTAEAFAEEYGYNYQVIEDIPVVSECGYGLVWTLSDDGVLSISTTTEGYSWNQMYDWTADSIRWDGRLEEIKTVIIGDGVQNIGSYAFNGCTELTTVILPDTVHTIGTFAFSDCTSLTEITLPTAITAIDKRVFAGCSSLTDIIIPNQVTSIGDYAFDSCTSLTDVDVPVNVESIGTCAFNNCQSLQTLTVNNPDCTMAVSESWAFVEGLPADTVIYGYEGSQAQIYAENHDLAFAALEMETTTEATTTTTTTTTTTENTTTTATTTTTTTITTTTTTPAIVNGQVIIEIDQVELTLDELAAMNYQVPIYVRLTENPGLTNIEFGISVDDRCEFSVINFSDALYIGGDFLGLNMTTATNDTQNFAWSAWASTYLNYDTQNMMLLLVTIPINASPGDRYAIEYVDEDAKLHVWRDSLSEINYVENGLVTWSDGWISIRDERTTTKATTTTKETTTTETTTTTEETITTEATTTTEETITTEATTTTEETITTEATTTTETTTTTTNEGDFGDGLHWSYDDETCTLTISGSGEMPDWGSADDVPWYAAYHTSIKNAVIEDGVTSIGMHAFYHCENLTSIELPESVTAISTSAFSDCTSLASIVLPSNLQTIGAMAFFGCTALTEITIPETVDSLEMFTFVKCTALESITVLNPDCTFASGSAVLSNDDGSSYHGSIIGMNGSTAQEYAETNGYTFVVYASGTLITGDLNSDGAVDATDAAIILVAAASLGSGNGSGLTAEQETAGDINNDQELDAIDASITLRYAAAIGSGEDASLEDFIN